MSWEPALNCWSRQQSFFSASHHRAFRLSSIEALAYVYRVLSKGAICVLTCPDQPCASFPALLSPQGCGEAPQGFASAAEPLPPLLGSAYTHTHTLHLPPSRPGPQTHTHTPGRLNSTSWNSLVLLTFVMCQWSVPTGEKSHCLVGDRAGRPLCRSSAGTL